MVVLSEPIILPLPKLHLAKVEASALRPEVRCRPPPPFPLLRLLRNGGTFGKGNSHNIVQLRKNKEKDILGERISSNEIWTATFQDD